MLGISLFQNMGSFTHHKKRRLPENGEGEALHIDTINGEYEKGKGGNIWNAPDSLGALAISKRSDKSENASVAQFEILENLGVGPEPPLLHYYHIFLYPLIRIL